MIKPQALLFLYLVLLCNYTSLCCYAQVNMIGSSETNGALQLQLIQVGRSAGRLAVRTKSLPSISTNIASGYVVGRFWPSRRDVVLSVSRLNARKLRISWILKKRQRHSRVLSLSHPIGRRFTILAGFDRGGDRFEDVAIVDQSASNLRWFILENPAGPSPHEAATFLHGQLGDTVLLRHSEVDGQSTVLCDAVRAGPKQNRLLVQTVSLGSKTRYSSKVSWKAPLGTEQVLRLQQGRRSYIAFFAPLRQRLVLIRSGSRKVFHLPKKQCSGTQMVLGMSRASTLSVLEICSSTQFILTRSKHGKPVDIGFMPSIQGTFSVPITDVRLPDIAHVPAPRSEVPAAVSIPTDTPPRTPTHIPTGTSTAAPTMTPTPTNTPSPSHTPSHTPTTTPTETPTQTPTVMVEATVPWTAQEAQTWMGSATDWELSNTDISVRDSIRQFSITDNNFDLLARSGPISVSNGLSLSSTDADPSAPFSFPRDSAIVRYFPFDADLSDSISGTSLSTSPNAQVVADIKKVGAGSLAITGAGARLSMPQSSLSSYTVSSWARIAPSLTSNVYYSVVSRGSIWEEGTNFTLGLRYRAFNREMRVFSYDSNGGFEGFTPWHSDTWVHIATTFDCSSGIRRVFFNGRIVGESVSSTCGSGASKPLIISSVNDPIDSGGQEAPFIGQIDDVVIWSEALSELEISELYGAYNGKTSGMVETPIYRRTIADDEYFAVSTESPYSKRMVFTSESSGGYANAPDLSQNILGYWTMDSDSMSDAANVLSCSLPFGSLFPMYAGQLMGSGHAFFRNNVPRGQCTNTDRLTPTALTISMSLQFQPNCIWRSGCGADGNMLMWKKNDATASGNGWSFEVGSSASGKTWIFRTNNKESFVSANVSTLPTLQWITIVVVYDGQSVKFFQDGQLLTTSGQTEAIQSTTGPLTIFANTNSSRIFGFGVVDEIGLWDRAFNEAEVTALTRRYKAKMGSQIELCQDSKCQRSSGWVGPDGTLASWFSEVVNNTQINGIGAPTGSTKVTSPSFQLSSFPALAGIRTTTYPFIRLRSKLLPGLDGTASTPTISSMVVSGSINKILDPQVLERTLSSASTRLSHLDVVLTGSCTAQVQSEVGGAKYVWNTGSGWTLTANADVFGDPPSDAAWLLFSQNHGTSEGAVTIRIQMSNTSGAACTISEINYRTIQL